MAAGEYIVVYTPPLEGTAPAPGTEGTQVESDIVDLGDKLFSFTGDHEVGCRITRGSRIYSVIAPGVMLRL